MCRALRETGDGFAIGQCWVYLCRRRQEEPANGRLQIGDAVASADRVQRFDITLTVDKNVLDPAPVLHAVSLLQLLELVQMIKKRIADAK